MTASSRHPPVPAGEHGVVCFILSRRDDAFAGWRAATPGCRAIAAVPGLDPAVSSQSTQNSQDSQDSQDSQHGNLSQACRAIVLLSSLLSQASQASSPLRTVPRAPGSRSCFLSGVSPAPKPKRATLHPEQSGQDHFARDCPDTPEGRQAAAAAARAADAAARAADAAAIREARQGGYETRSCRMQSALHWWYGRYFYPSLLMCVR